MESKNGNNRFGIPSDIQIPSTIPSDKNKEESRPPILKENSNTATGTHDHPHGRGSGVEER